MNYRIKGGNYIINKKGVYFCCTDYNIQELKAVIADIESGKGELIQEDARTLMKTDRKEVK